MLDTYYITESMTFSLQIYDVLVVKRCKYASIA